MVEEVDIKSNNYIFKNHKAVLGYAHLHVSRHKTYNDCSIKQDTVTKVKGCRVLYSG